MGVVRVTPAIVNYRAYNDISEMDECKVIKFCTQVDYIMS